MRTGRGTRKHLHSYTPLMTGGGDTLHTRGILIEFWQHLPSVITPSMAMAERGRVDPLVPIPGPEY